MMCLEVCDSPVEGESEQNAAHHTEQLNLEINSEVTKDSEEHLEAQPEQSLSLRDWLNSENQLHMNEDQSHMNEVQLEQSPMTEIRPDQFPGTREDV